MYSSDGGFIGDEEHVDMMKPGQSVRSRDEDRYILDMSKEYSKHVEAQSEGSNNIKYLLGENINIKEFERKQNPTKKKTLSQKKDAIEDKFLEIYNR